MKKDSRANQTETRTYFIEVTAANGWPLTTAQWIRVDEVRNALPDTKPDVVKKSPKEKGASKERPKIVLPAATLREPQPDDAFVEIECSSVIGGSSKVSRDDQRDLEFAAERKSWELYDRNRNVKGAEIRAEFREEFLMPPPPSPTQSGRSPLEESVVEEEEGQKQKQGPTPATETSVVEESLQVEEEAKYLTLPAHLRDKFIPFDFIPLCTKDRHEGHCVILSADKLQAAKNERDARIESGLERMQELQLFNEVFVLERQRNRWQMIEKLYTDSTFDPEILEAFTKKNEVISQEKEKIALSDKKKQQEAKEEKKKKGKRK